MSLSGETPRENLTLTEADLAACRPIVGEGGHVLRALCPFHGSDRQRSLRGQVDSGRFVCFACGAWGYMETARAQWREEQQRQVALQRPPAYRQRVPHRRQPPPRVPRQPAATKKLCYRFLNTVCACSSSPRPGSAARRVPGCPAGQLSRSVPAAARHFPGPGAAGRGCATGRGHLWCARLALGLGQRCA